MEKIIEKLIEIDNIAKSKIVSAESMRENMDEVIEEKLQKEKLKIDALYKAKIDLKKKELDEEYEKNKKRIEDQINIKVGKINEHYKKNQQEIVDKIVNKIIMNA